VTEVTLPTRRRRRVTSRRHAALLSVLGVTWVGCGGRAPVQAPAPSAPVTALRYELSRIFDDPVFANAHWGVMIQSIDTGELLYSENAQKLFMPASNLKLVTAAVALARLGPDYRFTTRVVTCDSVGGRTGEAGDVIVIGGGDPSLSARFHGGDATAVFREWADSLRAQGITRIAGALIGDDDLFDDVHLGPGWTWDDLGAAYAAEIGALLFNEGVVPVAVAPGDTVGAPARVIVGPPRTYLELDARVLTVADSTEVVLSADREPFSNAARLRGAIWVGSDTLHRFIAAHDPTRFFIESLREVLDDEQIEVAGPSLDGDDQSSGWPCETPRTLFVYQSPPLDSVLKPFLKVSQNQIGEMLLRYLGVHATDTGSVAAGQRVVRGTLIDWGIPAQYHIYYDGSGLSRYNYLAPEAIVRLLRVMAHREEFGAFAAALPIAGRDGTLSGRMRGTRAEDNARAKTGYIANARSLSGYVRTLDGELVAFSIIANNFTAPVDAVEYLQDLVVERLANFSRGRAGGPAPH